MNFLKAGKNIFGVQMSAAEKKAAYAEIGKIEADWQRRHEREIDAIILWRLHHTFGWGPVRLWRFYKGCHEDSSDLIKKFELDPTDDIWVSTQALKEYGIDLEQWEKKLEEERNGKET